jgi:ketosteroid isomerase-like protein
MRYQWMLPVFTGASLVGTWLLVACLLGACLTSGCASSPRPQAQVQQPPSKTSPSPRSNSTALLSPDAAKAATAAAVQQVMATELAFAKTMADRNFKAFITFLSPDAVFFSGSSVMHGPAEVAVQWQPYFDSPKAPFSWKPDHVEVLASGNLALSTGPVYEKNKIVARFNSVWRLEADNVWRIVFDKGEAVCSSKP